MKNKNIGKRLLSLALALVLLLSLVPSITPTANAAADKVFELDNGFTLTIHGGQVSHDWGDVRLHDVTTDLAVQGNKYSWGSACYFFKFRVRYYCDHEDYQRVLEDPFTVQFYKNSNPFKCDVAVNYTGTQTLNGTYTYTLTRAATEHTSTATTTPANCVAPQTTTYSRCELCYHTPDPVTTGSKDPNNHVAWSDWKSNGDGTHSRTCGDCKKTETVACSGGTLTCTERAVCTGCKTAYGETPDGHSLTYTATGHNGVTEACADCSHRQTAQLSSSGDCVYTGSPQTPVEMVYPAGWVGDKIQPTNADYENNTDAGTAMCTFSYENCTLTKTFIISPVGLSGTGVSVTPEESTYTGADQTPAVKVEVAGFGELTQGKDYELQWDSADRTAVNAYTVTVTGKGNYTGTVQQQYNIQAADLTGVSVQQDGYLTYNGQHQTPDVITAATTVDGSPVNFTYSMAADGPYGSMPDLVDAPGYTVWYKATAANHNDVIGSFDVEIRQAENQWLSDGEISDFRYGGAFPLIMPVAKYGSVNVRYSGTTNAGAHYDSTTTPWLPGNYTATFCVDECPCYAGLEQTDDFKITWDVTDTDLYQVDPANENGWHNSSIGITPAEDYVISTVPTGSWNDGIYVSTDTPDGKINIYIMDDNGAVSDPVEISYKLDKELPTGSVAFTERDAWEIFLHTISFGLFYREEITVTAAAEDALSGVDRVSYLAADQGLTLTQLIDSTDWTDMPDGGVPVTLEDAKQFVYYVRILDKAGNVIYLSTDGAVYDTTAPVIAGVESGTCYTTQAVTVTDANLDTVMLNGEAAAANLTLPGNCEATYTVVARDKAGNETSVTVQMLPISALTTVLDALDETNVTSADYAALERMIAETSALLAGDNLTEAEKTQLQDAIAAAQDLLQVVDDAQNAVATDALSDTVDITADNVTLADQQALEQAKADLEQALRDHGSNYTDEEKAILEENRLRIDAALAAIERVNDLNDAVAALPDTVQPDDEETAAAICDAKAAYDAMSEHEKSLVSPETVAKLEALCAAMVDYKITAGSGGSWTRGSSAGLRLTANGAYAKFTGLMVDGKTVSATCYTAVSGSTVITLKASYLETLSLGKHTITVCYEDGSAEGTFTVTANPYTGDEAQPMLWVAMLLLSAACIVLLLKKRTHAS